MSNQSKPYVLQLQQLRGDLFTFMRDLPSGDTLSVAVAHAEKIASLVAGQLEELQGARLKLNKANPEQLYQELECLI